jgi:hypothetical protein
MASKTQPGEPAFLTDDLEMQFVDAEHFAQEVQSNLHKGRALVRCNRPLGLNENLQVQVRAPGTDRRLPVGARVVFAQSGVLGLQLTDLDPSRKERLAEMVEASHRPGRRTEEAPLPGDSEDLDSDGVGDLDSEFLQDDGSTVVQARPRSDTILSEAPGVEEAPGADPAPVAPDPAEQRPLPRRASSTQPGADGTDPGFSGEPTRVQASRTPATAHSPEADPVRQPPPRSASVLPTEGISLRDDGVLRVPDAGLLLAAYLCVLKTEQLVVTGRCSRDPGQSLTLRLQLPDGERSVASTLVRTSGDFVVLGFGDPTPFADLLSERKEELVPLLEGPGLLAGTQDLPAGPVLGPGGASKKTDDLAPPELPTLQRDRVRFSTRRDLRHELEQNVKNGGLFVQSSPLDLRTRKHLEVEVEGRVIGQGLAADVVFADGGRVGFSFVDPEGAYRSLSEGVARLDSGDLASSGGRGATVDLRGQGTAVPPEGRLHAPLSDGRLLDLVQHRVDDPSQLAETSLLQLFDHLVRHRCSGVLELQHEDGFRRLYMHEGDVAFIEARPFDEQTSLGRILVSQRRLSEASLRDALARSKGSSRLLGRMLVLLGIIKRGDLVAALREQTRRKMDAPFGWKSGRYRWSGWVEPPGDSDLVVTKGASVLARHIRSRFEALSQPQMEELFGRSGARVVEHFDLDAQASDLQLQPRELRFLELSVDGQRTLHDAVMGSPIGKLASLRVLALCLAMGAVRPRSGSRLKSADSRADKAARDELRDELEEVLQMMQGQNHFEVLGVHWSSHHRFYREAWDKARNRYDPKRPPQSRGSRAAKETAAQIIRRLDEAYEVLKEPSKRSSYRKELFDPTERQYAAEMLIKQGQVAQMQGRRVEALEALETAVELDPSQRNRSLLASAREGKA